MVHIMFTWIKRFFGYTTEDNLRKRGNPDHDNYLMSPPKQRRTGSSTCEDNGTQYSVKTSNDFLHPLSSNITQNVEHHRQGLLLDNASNSRELNPHLQYMSSDRMDGVIEVSDDECEEVIEVSTSIHPRPKKTSLRRSPKATKEVPTSTFYGKGSSSPTFNLEMERKTSEVGNRKNKSTIGWTDFGKISKDPFRVTSPNRSGAKTTNTKDGYPLCQWSSAQKENVITVTDDDADDVDDGVEVGAQAAWISPDVCFKTSRGATRHRLNVQVDTYRGKLKREAMPIQEDVRVVKVVKARNVRLKRVGLFPFDVPSPILPTMGPIFRTRSSLLQSHVSRQSSNSLSSCSSSKSTGINGSFRKSTALNESYCMMDKLKYSALLRQCGQIPNITEGFKMPSTVIRTGAMENVRFGGKQQPHLIDLTKMDKEKPSIVAAKKQVEGIKIPVVLEHQRVPSTSATRKVADFEIDQKRSKSLFRKSSFFEFNDEAKLRDPVFVGNVFSKYEQTMLEKEKKIYHREVEAELSRSTLIQEFIDDKLMTKMHLYDVSEAEEEIPLPELTPEIQKRIDASLRPNPPNEVLVDSFSIRITRRDMNTLVGLHWLNDEVINFYMNLLMQRGKLDNYPSVYAFNTFFYPKLTSGGHSSLKRWTRKVDVFSHDLNIVPIHLGMHWCMAAIDYRHKEIRYYDSMGGNNNQCLANLLKYLQDESLDKKKTSFDTTGWTTTNMKDIPQQMNGSDCGMFSCMYAEYNCRDAEINFTQTDMPYFRRKMVYEIAMAKLML